MSFNDLLYPGMMLGSSADGDQPYAVIEPNQCCTSVFCIDDVGMACGFIDLLPTGPLWDAEKENVRQTITDNGGLTGIQFDCPSMVTYSVYLAQVLQDMVTNAMMPSVLESDPRTAYKTLDDWLKRFNWQDCYRSYCRSAYMAQFSPYDFIGDCGEYEYYEPTFPPDLELALKYGIVQALHRASRGVIRNLEGLNWVIAPLNAVLAPSPYPQDILDFLAAGSGSPAPCWCDMVSLDIGPTGADLYLPPADPCTPGTTVSPDHVHDFGAIGTRVIYPGVAAAECIVRSLLNRNCPNILVRI